MPITFNERLIAYLTLISGLAISAVAVYYSVVGLATIFAAAVIPIIVMGTILEVSKLVATLWLKQNWHIAPRTVKAYLMIAIFVLMFITSMGIFGFLSKAHLDQTVPTGDVAAKVALIDEKIKVERENIDAARKALSQMDAQVDQRLSRSSDDRGAERAVQIRRQQQSERTKLQRDIAIAQDNISKLNAEKAPIAAELRKVEAEVGPIKYIAQFFYGETDQTILEKAVTWVIIILIVVFDPLAVILLIASQISFENFRKRKLLQQEELSRDAWVADVGEKPTAEELSEIATEGDSPEKESDIVSTATVTAHHPDTHPYLREGFKYPENWKHVEPLVANTPAEEKVEFEDSQFPPIEIVDSKVSEIPVKEKEETLFVQNEEQKESSLWSKTISQSEYIQSSELKKDKLINYWADLVRSKKISMSDVPEYLLLEVRARV